MKRFKNKARMVFCLLIVVAFFLPAYRNLSGYTFVSLALKEPDASSQLTFTDAMIAVLPLLLVPSTAIMLFLRSWQRIPVRRIYVGLPLLFFLFFTGLLFWGERHNPEVRSLFGITMRLQFGYFLGLIGCVALPFTRNRKRRRHRKPEQADTLPELAV